MGRPPSLLGVLKLTRAVPCPGVTVGVPGALGPGYLTVTRAAWLTASEPTPLLATARKILPLSASVVTKKYCVVVAPGMSLKVVPPPDDSCHFTSGTGRPLAATMKWTTLPGETVWSEMSWVNVGGRLTVTSDSWVVTSDAMPLCKTARYRVPLSAAVAVNVYGVVVALA